MAEPSVPISKLVPGALISVMPGDNPGCPCVRCTSAWGEALYANGDHQRGGWCPELRQLVGIKAGYVSRYCPIPEAVEGEVHDPGTVRLQPLTIIPAGASVKGGERSPGLITENPGARRECASATGAN